MRQRTIGPPAPLALVAALALVIGTVGVGMAAGAGMSGGAGAGPATAAKAVSASPAAAPVNEGGPMQDSGRQLETAVVAGGCFWCVEAVFESVEGVTDAVSGYTGGHVPDPTYKQVCTGETGHAEAVRITFDPARISYEEILLIFFGTHDPTTPNRQGADTGTQYRSAVFYATPEQKREAEAVIARLDQEKAFPRPIVTEVVPLKEFYPAEFGHQEYYARNSNQPYCQLVIAPKLKKLRKEFADKLKDRGERP